MSSTLVDSEQKLEENNRSVDTSKDDPETDNVLKGSNSSISEPSSAKTTWLVGDIVWSKIPGHPWWPSMVAYEPNTAIYFKYTGRTRYYHVQFFGHEPMRGWATEKSIVLYQGKAHFLSLRLSTHGKLHKVGSKQLPLWETAVKMADRAVPLNRHERKLCFTFKYNFKEKQDSTSGQGQITEVFNGFIKPKAIKDSGTCCGTPKADNKLKGKQSNEISEIACNEDVIDDKNADLEPVVKKTKINDDTVKAVENLSLIKNQDVQVKCQENTSKDGQNQTNKQDQAEDKIRKQDQDNTESPTSLKLKMKRVEAVSPVTGKRKRGRPRKNTEFVIVNSMGSDTVDGGLIINSKKQKASKNVRTNKTHGKKSLNNNVNKPGVDNEKTDNASDSNSTASTDLETRSDFTKGLPRQKECVCVVCERPENLVFCEGVCNSAYHLDCLGLSCALPDKFICDECMSGNHTCFICRKTSNVVQCSASSCGKFYHLDCLRMLSHVKIEGEKFTCPLHFCNVCGPAKAGSYKRRLTCCTRCPTAYHTGTCIVAGCLPITSHYLVCKRHFLADKKKAHHSHVNVNWCFVCSIGGTLICCESCPAAFHAECIDVSEIPEGHFFCRDCATGKELLYGEIVWVKLGMYRWWPAQICNPNNIPTNIQNLHHQPGEFPVQFLGSHDYYWIHRGRVFCYQEGDKGSCSAGGKYLGNIFKKALVEAKEKYAGWQKAQEEKAEKDLEKLSKKPAAYKHLKVNRYTTATRYVVEESEWSTCECSVDDENPCGPDSHCLNRILLVECSPSRCPAKEQCQNQCFVKRQYLDCEPFKSKKCGWGLKAKEDAKKGQFIIEYVGELINEATCRERVRKGSDEGVMNYYMLTIDKDCIIDAGPMGNLARFMNHSCNPNCETQKWTVNGEIRVGLFAKRDIMAGEELVFDYQLDCLGNEKKKCSCGSKNCSGFLGVRPKTQHAQLQEDKKKKMELKKKKKKAKKNPVKDGSSPGRNRRSSLPGWQPSTDAHLDITPEAFPASELEVDVDRNLAFIEKVLTCPSADLSSNVEHLNYVTFKPDQPKPSKDNTITMSNQPMATLSTSQDKNQVQFNTSSSLPTPSKILPSSTNLSPPSRFVADVQPLDKFPSFLLNTPPTPYTQDVSSPDGRLNTSTVASPSTSTELASNSTLAQFSPKNLPVVTRAFHHIGNGFQAHQFSVAPSSSYGSLNQSSIVNHNVEPLQTKLSNDVDINSNNLPAFPLINPVWPLSTNQQNSLDIATTSTVDEGKRNPFPWGYDPSLF